MDTQLQSLDDIVSRVRAQNNAHHAAHTSSLHSLSSTVQSSYSSIGDHLSTTFTRVQSIEKDISAQTSVLKDSLRVLSEDGTVRVPLQELRDIIGRRNLAEYNPTGETPQRVIYSIPANLPRTEAHDIILSRMRDRSSSDTTRSPSKGLVFNDKKDIAPSLFEDSSTSVHNKPKFSRSISANAAPGIVNGPSLRELDINILSQDTQLLKSPPVISQPNESDNGAAPPYKKQRGEKDSTKLPMKKMGRKTVGAIHGVDDRENLTITNFSASVGPGLSTGRRLRSHGSS